MQYRLQHYALLAIALLTGPLGAALVGSIPSAAIMWLGKWVVPWVMVLYVFVAQLQQSPRAAKLIADAQAGPTTPEPPKIPPPLAALFVLLCAISLVCACSAAQKAKEHRLELQLARDCKDAQDETLAPGWIKLACDFGETAEDIHSFFVTVPAQDTCVTVTSTDAGGGG